MKRFAACLVLLIQQCLGITLDNVPLLSDHVAAPPTSYNFYPWSPCVLLGAQGVFSNAAPYFGSAFGSGNAAVWPVGPQSFVSALHINDFRPETGLLGVNKWEKIRYLGTDYHITGTYIIANDVVLYTITNTLPQWHQIWQGPYTQDNVTCLLPGVCFTNTSTISLTNMEFMAVLPGPVGNAVCLEATLAPQSAWGYATNYLYQNSEKTIEYAPVDWTSFQTAWQQNGFFLTQPMLYGGSLTVKFQYRSAIYPLVTPESNFGGRTGDSGGALFVRQRGATTGVWKLVGMANSAGYCQNSPVAFSVIDQALGWDSQYWTIVGQPQNAATYSSLKTNYVQSGYQYTNCPSLASIPDSTDNPVTPPPPPPPVVLPTVYISTPTNSSTITNVPYSVTAIASASNATVTEVRFYANSNLLSIDITSPYTLSWSPTNGTYTLYAVVRDSVTNETTSSNISVTVNVPSPPPPPPPITNYPTVSITAPLTGYTLTNATYVVTASASQTNSGSIQEVRLYANGTLVGVDYTSPYSFIWTPATNGVYSLEAVARNNSSNENTSTSVSVTVDVRPSVQPPPAPILLPAGSDFDAMIQRMDLLQRNIAELVEYLKRVQNSVHAGPQRITNTLLATNLTR